MTKITTNPTSRLVSLILALAMCFALGASAFAVDVTVNGGSGSTPVNLSSTIDGTIGGAPAATAMSVTVPTTLPMAMGQNGDVTTATDCKIVNNSYGAVRVKSVTISAASDWNLTAFGPKSTLAGEKVDSNKLGFAMTIGGGNQVKTSTNDATQTLISAPIDGCSDNEVITMTGIGDTSGNTAAISYSAIVTPLSGAVTDATIANVVFIIEWDIAA